MSPYVAVVGPGACDDAVAALAEAVGRALAQRGAVLVCGGLGGVMAAACRGAQEAGGVTVGLLPGTDRTAGNAWLTVAVATGLGTWELALGGEPVAGVEAAADASQAVSLALGPG